MDACDVFRRPGYRCGVRRGDRGPTSRQKQEEESNVIGGFPQTRWRLWLLIAITQTGGGSSC
jgi:hypothetical protein